MHWSRMQERGSYQGIRFLLLSYRLLGRKGLWLFLFPVVCYMYATGKTARQASRAFLERVRQQRGSDDKAGRFDGLRHFCMFADSAFDKIDAWTGRITPAHIRYTGEAEFDALYQSGKGAIFIGSHLGNLEVCRALSRARAGMRINVLVFTHHAVEFNRMLQKINPDVGVNLIQVTEMGPDLAILLKEKVDNGEIIVIVGDRTSTTTGGRVCYANFLGKPAPFSQGPFVLAAVLGCPVYFLFCLREKGEYRVVFEKYADALSLPRKERQQVLTRVTADYAERLEHYASLYPHQWFNFFDFWQADDSVERGQLKET